MLVHPRPRRSVLDFAGIASSTVVPLPRDLVALERLLAEGRDRAVNAKMARIAAGRTTK
jgi:hypothetical protein